MKDNSLRTLTLDSSTLGELREALAALEGLDDQTFVTFETHVEIRFTQKGSRVKMIHAFPGQTDDSAKPSDAEAAQTTGDLLGVLGGNRAARRSAEKVNRRDRT